MNVTTSITQEYDRQVKAIRKHIKQVCPSLSVRRGTGTAYCWIDIAGTGSEFGNFTENEAIALFELGINSTPFDKSNCAAISPDKRSNFLRIWGLA